jgi:Fur family iron response transcriptional regulator
MSAPHSSPPKAAATLEISRQLLAHGIQPTPQRIEIASVFLCGDVHLSAEQVIARVAGNGRPVSKATVYNTLGLFRERGLLSQVSVDSTRVFYDSNTSPHYHFFNVDTGVLTDGDGPLPTLETLPAPPPGTMTEAVDVVIRVRNGPTPAT